MSVLDCKKVTRAPWFQSLSFSLEPGQVRLLMGPTGSGKSLILRALADLDAFDSGEVFLRGTERDEIAPGSWRRQVLYLHQSAPRLAGSVLENLKITQKQNADAPRNPFGLELELDAAKLSGGQAQLLAISRALATDPAVYLLDESTSALDPESAALAERELRHKLEGGAAMLWVSHDERIAKRMGAEILSLGELAR